MQAGLHENYNNAGLHENYNNTGGTSIITIFVRTKTATTLVPQCTKTATTINGPFYTKITTKLVRMHENCNNIGATNLVAVFVRPGLHENCNNTGRSPVLL